MALTTVILTLRVRMGEECSDSPFCGRADRLWAGASRDVDCDPRRANFLAARKNLLKSWLEP